MTAALAPEPTAPAASVLDARHRTATTGIVLVVTLLAFEAMSVGTVMPVLARDLDGLPLYAWGFSATLISGLLTTVLGGGWVDRSGPGRPLLAGLAVFVAGLAVAGAAPAMAVFIGGRVLQGLGTGVAMVAVYVLIARAYPEELRPRVFAALAAAWVLPSLVGPAVGGFVAEHAGWRWVFLGLIPLVVPAAAMLLPALRDLRPADGPPAPVSRSRYLAAVAAAAGAGAFLYGIDDVTVPHLLLATAGIAGIAAGLPRLLPAGALRMRRGLPSVVLVRGLLAGAFFGMDAFIPLALTGLHGFGAAQAGVALTVGALGWSGASQIQGRSARPRAFFVRLGAALVTLGIAGVVVALEFSGWATVPAWTVGGAGMGFAISSLSVLTLDASPEGEQGANSAALQIADQLGSSLIVGAAGAVVAALGAARLGAGVAVSGAAFAAVAAVALAASFRLEARP
ncbi:MFS transporter [Actinomadura parmotrematis]|uniref:MFS transporter n=1 Tax=Actinomadura parmotrematis TaxID=2864039 RepID=A0ABS7FTQ7_9ACTN|nr:MFS transporter [Actinomadura parmotrematis]MBW8482933.1 MFS transporter [Actinomadura parmotrematis]